MNFYIAQLFNQSESFIDLYDIDGCETVTLGTSTLTAYITY